MDRAEVIKALEEWSAELDKISGSHTWQYRKKVLAETIAALREPKRERGEWKWNGKFWECSVCRGNRFHDLVLGMDSQYCGRCGADMRPEGGAE